MPGHWAGASRLPRARCRRLLNLKRFLCRLAAPEQEADAALKESLLQQDVEAGQAPTSERSWFSLFGTALVFVWPDDCWLQVSLPVSNSVRTA